MVQKKIQPTQIESDNLVELSQPYIALESYGPNTDLYTTSGSLNLSAATGEYLTLSGGSGGGVQIYGDTYLGTGASDETIVSGSLTVGGVAVPTISSASTLTNKRVTPRVLSTASASSFTPNSDSYDTFAYTALAANLTINAPSGTPTDGQKVTLRIKDNGTARTLTWNAIYRGIGSTLPTSTVANKTAYFGMIYNAADTKWDVFTSQEP